ncbi:unnamed protein product [Dimorphilus gyrociliatus]|uniref:Uncharacterized protein n=1 Tax=Dimorphilus gyrociliatus TaxID=2664684 RepID=A0A7I8VCC0_9ANNE|nr:unnamed protein product [Dimorphilus gyrociliatus]
MSSYLCGAVKENFVECFKSLNQFLDERENENKDDDEAIVFYDGNINRSSLSFSEWSKSSRNFAKNFLRSVKKSELVLLLVPTCREFPISFMGLQRLGLNTVLVSNKIQLEGILSHIKPDALVIEENYLLEIPSSSIEEIPIVVLIGEAKKFDYIPAKKLLLYNDLIKENNDDTINLPKVNSENDLIVLLTSGTTGMPKLVQHSQWSYICQVIENDSFQNTSFVDRQMSYTGGFGFIITSIVTGRKSIFSKFTAQETANCKKSLKVLKLEKCPMAFFLGYLLCDSLNHKEELKELDGTLKFILTGGQVLNNTFLSRLFDILPNVILIDVYGAVEFGAMFFRIFMKNNLKPIMKLPAFSQITIRNDMGEVVERGETGHIWVKNRGCLKEYRGNPSATRKVVPLNGWHNTGDFGVIEKDGSARVTGRRCDEINVGSVKFFPLELEEKIIHFECIKDVIVVGIPDDRLGESLCAVVQLKENYLDNNKEILKENILQYCSENIPSFPALGYACNIDNVVFIDELHKTYTNKVQRKSIREYAINSLKE